MVLLPVLLAVPLATLPAAAAPASSPPSALEETCRYRPSSEQVGQLPVNPVDEASGMVWDPISKSFFVINDSGDEPRFFRVKFADLSRDKISQVHEIRFEKWNAFDLEDLSMGPCPSPMAGDCLALADIGDNRDRRKHIEIAFVPMLALRADIPPAKVTVEKVVRLKYPEHPTNAEAFSILDRDRAVIVTKSQDRKTREARAASVFEVSLDSGRLRKVAEFDVPSWVANKGLGGLVTGMSVVPGARGFPRKVVLLTYQYAIELEVLSGTGRDDKTKVEQEGWKVRARRVLDLDYLEQQEAVAYDDQERLFYSTEVPMKVFGAKYAPIRMIEKVQCP